MKKKLVIISDKMQSAYRYYVSEAIGKNFHPDFKPDLTPPEMLRLGVFGGKYMSDCRQEFPASWFKKVEFSPEFHNPKLNFFGVNASQPLSVWRAKGWIHRDDPRGWFQWYCRYYMGRRHEDDLWQIKRWKAFRRHWSALKIHCLKGDFDCRKKQRQSLLHWAYDSRKA